ncbi:MAG: bifunctional phosphopantothenoylcysteine decarboxylase/phosphopantothenate--cysteine ligase CoaBC [Gemmatimonadetes bacterium]|nr:bifunctional phosphopantothenoylcysteine decarboxylase/phosphopantothenate--cysteine ligase CoaBC [Gemmatimonadota bacterium]
MRPFDGRRVLLVVSGGIAAYKSAFLCRRLLEAGASIDVLLTESAARFVGRVTFEGILGHPVHTDLWTSPMAHLELGKRADVIVVAPATADLIWRLATGAASDLATTTVLAAPCPVIVCPAMNTRMWEHPATRTNVDRLRQFGYAVVGPDEGDLAEGETGPGRLVEPDAIVASVGRALERRDGFRGLKVVTTAGPTRTPLDPVRYLSNRSSGRMGYALAAAAWRRGGDVTLISGPGSASRPIGPRVLEVETAPEMLAALERELGDAHVLLMAAAVGDFETDPSDEKIKKGDELELRLRGGPDLLLETKTLRSERGIFTLGFALESEDALARGREKLERKGMQLVAINSASEPDAGMEVSTNRVVLVDESGATDELPLARKEAIADQLLDRIEASLGRS